MCGLAGGFVSAKAGQMMAGDNSSKPVKPLEPKEPVVMSNPTIKDPETTNRLFQETTKGRGIDTGLQIGGTYNESK
jgi:hypothetical protein